MESKENITSWLRSFFLLLALFLEHNSAQAANISSGTTERGTKFLAVSGPLVAGDAKKFQDLFNTHMPSIVSFDSPGGLLMEGLEIGSIIAARGIDTLVTQKTRCASACALAWLGGRRRYMEPSALIGFHAAYIRDGEYLRESGVGNALVGAYIAKLGLSYSAVRYITSPSPTDMRWLSFRDALAHGISVFSIEETRLLTKPKGELISITAPNYQTAKRAVGNLYAELQKSGMLGLAASVQQCFQRSSDLRSLDSIQYCFTLDLITSELEAWGRKKLGVPPLEHLSASQVLNRTGILLDNYGFSPQDRQGLLDVWSRMAYQANVESAK